MRWGGRGKTFIPLSPLGLNFGSIFRKTALESTLPSFHTVPESSVTSPRSLSGPRVSHGNTQRRRNCSLPRKDAPLEERKKANSGAKKVGKSGEKKKKTNAENHWAERDSARGRPRPRPWVAPRPWAPDPLQPARASPLCSPRAERFSGDRRLDLLLASGFGRGRTKAGTPGPKLRSLQGSEVQPHRPSVGSRPPWASPPPPMPGPPLRQPLGLGLRDSSSLCLGVREGARVGGERI